MIRSKIVGTGSSVPDKKLTNDELARLVDTNDEWIRTRTGISERRIAVDETAGSLAVEAGRKALEASGTAPAGIELIIVGTVTPDMVFPSTACAVQRELEIASGVPAFDVAAACSGFLFALDVADTYVRSGKATSALVVGVDLFSRIIDWKDRATCVLFGDGAGAAVIKAVESEDGIISSSIHSDGRYWEKLYAPAGVKPSPFESRESIEPYVVMKGSDTFKVAVRTIAQTCEEALNEAGLTSGDIKLMIPHQANLRIILAAAKRLDLRDDQIFVNIEKYGNTSAGSIALALDEAVRSGSVEKGDYILLVAFGGGLTWASTIIKW